MNPYRIARILRIALFLIGAYVNRYKPQRIDRIVRDFTMHEARDPEAMDKQADTKETRREVLNAERLACSFLPPPGPIEIAVYLLLAVGGFFIHLSKKAEAADDNPSDT